MFGGRFSRNALARGEKLDVQSDGLEKLLEGRAQRRVIINYEDA